MPLRAAMPSPAHPVVVDRAVAAMLERLLFDAGRLVDQDHRAAKACIDQAAALLECEAARIPVPAAEAPGCPTLAPWQVRRVAAHVEAHMARTLRIAELAGAARLAESWFARAFKGSFGMTPHAYLVHRRIARAQELMLGTDQTLSQIALACGMADQAHFTRLFRRCCGAAPAAWRRARRGADRVIPRFGKALPAEAVRRADPLCPAPR